MKRILGINSTYHESAACLIEDGQLVAVVEEERFNRIKHAKSALIDNPHILPVEAINHCLKEAGITLKEVDYIAFSFNPAARLESTDFTEEVEAGDWGSESGEQLFYQKLQEVPQKLCEMAGEDITPKFNWVEHHISHAGSAFFVSPYEEAAVFIVDGIGEIESTTLYKGEGNKITLLDSIIYPHSLGFLWEKIAKFLGFSEYDAAKIMGLASYGNPQTYYEQFCSFVKVKSNTFTIDADVVRFRVEDYTELEKLFGKKREREESLDARHADIAAALQQITEEALLKLSDFLYRETRSKNLCLAGGVALNCVANSVLHEYGHFDNIYIQPAANDAGTAIGAAYYIWHQILDNPRSYVMDSPYQGPEYSDEEIRAVLDHSGKLTYSYHDNIEAITAKLVTEGNIIGWFQGRMEIGPRALGNRTLVADPRNPKMRDILNIKVKHREYFRPFAPSVLSEKAAEWFRIPKETSSSDFMLFAYDVFETKRMLIPAVTHVDGTSRIQTVQKKLNPKYHKLISEFEKLTGVPIVLNTSFNDSEPIVCTPQDAVNTYLKTKIDYLVIGNFLVSKGQEHRHVIELPHQEHSYLFV